MDWVYTTCQILSDSSLTPIPASHPEKMVLALWACIESRARALAKAHTQLVGWRTKWRNYSFEQYSESAKFWDPTWSSKPWRMGGEGFFCHIKWIFCFCSSHCLLGCFAKLVPVPSCVSFSSKHLAPYCVGSDIFFFMSLPITLCWFIFLGRVGGVDLYLFSHLQRVLQQHHTCPTFVFAGRVVSWPTE